MVFAAEHDIVILGGGPAGAAAAIRLAHLGLDVGVVERRRFPRSHVGICISDETLPLIDYLGVGQEFDRARFWRRQLTAVCWGNSDARLVPQNGYHVDRGVLDELLLCRARGVGARVYQPMGAQQIEPLADSSWKLTIASGERRQHLRARFIVDAAGRRPAIRGVRIKDGPPLVAVHANWAIGATTGFDGLIEAGEDAWLWYAQTGRDRAVASVFCDPRRLRVGKGASLQAKYSALLRQFRALKPPQLAEQRSHAEACDATSQHAEDSVSDRHIRLGDSCFSVDPLSSQGLHLALQSGLQGAVIVNTILGKPENTDAAQHFFRRRTAELIGRYARRTTQEYGKVAAVCSDAFWRERGGDVSAVALDPPAPPVEPTPHAVVDQVVVSPSVTFGAAPVIDGSFVEIRQVVRHAGLDGDVAYVEGIDLVRLLSVLPPRFAYGDIPDLWRGHIPPETGRKIASWLSNRRVLTRAS